MKKLLVVKLLIFALLVLASCGNNGNVPEAQEPANEPPAQNDPLPQTSEDSEGNSVDDSEDNSDWDPDARFVWDEEEGQYVLSSDIVWDEETERYILARDSDRVTDEQENGDERENGEERENGDVRQVGSETHGFIQIPRNWANFANLDPMPGALQWTDGGGVIISINYFGAELELEALTVLSTFATCHENNGAVNIDGARVTLNNQQVYQMYGYFPATDSFIVMWMFDSESGGVHYIAVEGPSERIMTGVEIVESTFSFR
jgi:hypothetical protein